MKSTNSEVYLGAVYDAMRALKFRAEQFYIDIKPLIGYSEMISGPAFTTYGEVVKYSVNYSEVDRIRIEMYNKAFFTNNPIVLLQANDNKVAHSGDITSQIYKTLGAIGFITDGLVRDVDKIDGLDFPVFASGCNPIDAIDYWALTRYQIPIAIKSVVIEPGDQIYASRDGVICVPKSILESFRHELSKVLSKEEKARILISNLAHSETMVETLQNWIKENGRW